MLREHVGARNPEWVFREIIQREMRPELNSKAGQNEEGRKGSLTKRTHVGRGLVAQECGFCVKMPMAEGEGRQQWHARFVSSLDAV